MASNDTVRLQGLTDREAVVDAVLRALYAIDDNDWDLFQTAFTADAIFDLTPVNKIGREFSETHGRDAIVAQLKDSVGKMDTGHCLSNWRIQLNGDTAEMTAYGLAQHFRQGEGPDPTKDTCFLMCNRYKCTLVRAEEGLWRCQRFVIDNQWCHGDPSVMGH